MFQGIRGDFFCRKKTHSISVIICFRAKMKDFSQNVWLIEVMVLPYFLIHYVCKWNFWKFVLWNIWREKVLLLILISKNSKNVYFLLKNQAFETKNDCKNNGKWKLQTCFSPNYDYSFTNLLKNTAE